MSESLEDKANQEEKILNEYRQEFKEKYPFDPKTMIREEYNVRMENYANKKYWEEHDSWHDSTMPEKS